MSLSGSKAYDWTSGLQLTEWVAAGGAEWDVEIDIGRAMVILLPS